MRRTRLILITDVSFGNARGYKSQLGFLFLMTDKVRPSNIVLYGSSRCRRVTQSVLASKVLVLVINIDISYVIRQIMEEITGRFMDIEAYVGSKTLLDVVEKDAGTQEKRLQIYICSRCEL